MPGHLAAERWFDRQEAGLPGQQRLEEDTLLVKSARARSVEGVADGIVTTGFSNAELYAILDEEEIGSFYRVANLSQPRR